MRAEEGECVLVKVDVVLVGRRELRVDFFCVTSLLKMAAMWGNEWAKNPKPFAGGDAPMPPTRLFTHIDTHPHPSSVGLALIQRSHDPELLALLEVSCTLNHLSNSVADSWLDSLAENLPTSNHPTHPTHPSHDQRST